jgi:hypothetical protein
MVLTRLLPAVMLLFACAGPALAQSRESKTSSDSASQIPSSDFLSGAQAQPDASCLFIHSYLMVRDSPHSDGTHVRTSTTCVPTARFRMYSATIQERVKDGNKSLLKLDSQPVTR